MRPEKSERVSQSTEEFGGPCFNVGKLRTSVLTEKIVLVEQQDVSSHRRLAQLQVGPKYLHCVTALSWT